jgi:hypothetical protein
MGVSHSGAELAKKVEKWAYATGKANHDAVFAAALQYKEGVLEQAAVDTKGTLKMRRWGKQVRKGTADQPDERKGIKLGAGFDVQGYEHATALLKARPQGTWKVLEYGAKSHPIVAGGRKSVAHKAAALNKVFGLQIGARELTSMRSDLLRFKVLRFGPGGPVRPYANHRRTPGKFTWTKGAKRSEAAAIKVFEGAHQRALLKTFGP